MAASNLHENHRARMQARVERDGLESLAEHEALEYCCTFPSRAWIPMNWRTA